MNLQKKVFSGLLLLLVTILAIRIQLAGTSYDDVLVNGDFETGTLEGWSVEGVARAKQV